jgi:hypothetical protein
MDDQSTNDNRRLGFRVTVAVASCAIGLAIIAFGFGSAKKSEAPATTQSQRKPARVWNMALGNMVMVAQELGFTVKASRNAGEVDPTRISSMIEGQLQSLREIYRLESEKDPTLMGSMTVQFTINPSGEVSQVKEFASRIADVGFKKTVLAEISKWSFRDVPADNFTVNCPLIFVREGMDITTVAEWEKSLGQLGDETALAKSTTQPGQQGKASETAKPVDGKSAANVSKVSFSTPTATKSAAPAYQIKYATSLRKEPSFSSVSVAKFSVGTKVTLLASRGQWLEVRAVDHVQSGFIRKEFVTPLEVAQKQTVRD